MTSDDEQGEGMRKPHLPAARIPATHALNRESTPSARPSLQRIDHLAPGGVEKEGQFIYARRESGRLSVGIAELRIDGMVGRQHTNRSSSSTPSNHYS